MQRGRGNIPPGTIARVIDSTDPWTHYVPEQGPPRRESSGSRQRRRRREERALERRLQLRFRGPAPLPRTIGERLLSDEPPAMHGIYRRQAEYTFRRLREQDQRWQREERGRREVAQRQAAERVRGRELLAQRRRRQLQEDRDEEDGVFRQRVRFLSTGQEYTVYPPESPYVEQQWLNFQRLGKWAGRPMFVHHQEGDVLVLDLDRAGPPQRDRRTGCLVRNEYSVQGRTVLELDAPGLIPLVTHMYEFAQDLQTMVDVEQFRLTAIDRQSGMVFLESQLLDVPQGRGGVASIPLLALIDELVMVWVELDDPSPNMIARLVGSILNEYQPLFDRCWFRLEFFDREQGGGCGPMKGLQVLKKRRLVWSPSSATNDCFFECLKELGLFTKESVGKAREEYGWGNGWQKSHRPILVSEAKFYLVKEKIDYHILVMFQDAREDRLYTNGEKPETCSLVCYRSHYYVDRGPSLAAPFCPLCHAGHLPTQTCVPGSVRYWQRKEGPDPEQTTAYYDFETRNDIETAIITYEKELWSVGPRECALLPTRRVVYRQRAIAVSMYYQGVTETVVGLDCIDQLFAWLDRHPRVLKMLAHNAARFDSLLIREYVVKKGWPIRNLIQANGRLLAMMIHGIEFGCTFRFLPRSLKAIGTDFQIDEKKMINIPEEKQVLGELKTLDDLLLYKKHEWTPEKYIEWIRGESWSDLYEEYCGLDSRVLGKAWSQFRAGMKDLFARMYTEGRQFRGKHPSTEIDAFITLPQMVYAHWKFQAKTRAKLMHIGEEPVTLPRPLYDFYRLFIVGGRSQQIPGYYHEPMKYVDVVSLYPCAQSIYPYPTRKYPEQRVTEYVPDSLGIYCISHLVWPEEWWQFNPFPARDEKGRKLFWDLEGVDRPLFVTSVDLMMAEEVGATYEVLWGYVWARTWNPFAEFMNFFVQVKKGEDAKPKEERNASQRQAAKLCLNSLYGKMAQAPPKYEYEEFDVEKGADWDRVPPKKKCEIVEWERYQAWKAQEWEIVSCIQTGSRVRIFRRPTYQEKENRKYHPAHYGVFILAWSRYHMFQYALRVRDGLGKPMIYGSETDSLILPAWVTEGLEPPVEGPYSFESYLASCPFENVGTWRRYWEKYQDRIFCFGTEIGNIVDEVESAGKGELVAALLVQPKTYALQFLGKDEKTGKETCEWQKRWKGVPTQTRDGKEIIRLAHYVSVLLHGGVAFTKLTAFLRIQEDVDRLPVSARARLDLVTHLF